MKLTVEQLPSFINSIPQITPDFEVYIEYPERYVLHRKNDVEIDVTQIYDECIGDYQDMIPACTIGANFEKKRLYIYHHF